MTFTYTYRDRTGAKREGRIAAASRDAAFAALKSRGISPLSIREGNGRAACPHAAENGDADNDRAGAPRPPQSRVDGTRIDAAVSSKPPHRARRRVLAALGILALLAILGGGAWWYGAMRSSRPTGDSSPVTVRPTKAMEAVTNQVPRAAQHTQAPASSVKAAERGEKPSQAPSMHMGRAVVEISATTNADGTVIERIRTDDGKIHSKVYSAAEPVFGYATDQLLAAAVDGDSDGPPMPGATAADEKLFLESLKKPIEILDTDTPDIRALKEKVMQARADMAELLSQGREFAEVLAEHRKMQEENAAVRREVASELQALVESGDTAAALEYRKRVNAALEQMGVKPLTTAITEEERAERKERRRARRKERLGL